MTWAFATFRDDQGVTATIELGRSRTDTGYDSTLADMVKSISGVEIPDDTAVENLLGLDTTTLQTDFTLACIISAVRSAIFEFDCLHKGVNLSESLGSEGADSVALRNQGLREVRSVLA